MPITNLSPNTDNYFIGKGIVKWKETGETEYRDLGNVPTFEITPALDILDHFSSRSGIRSKDRSVVRQKSMNLRMVLEETTADNLHLMLLGALNDTVTPMSIDILSLSEITGALRFVGTNDIGAKVQIDLPSISIKPNAAFSPISDEWGNMELNAEVLISSGHFGTLLWNITAEVTS